MLTFQIDGQTVPCQKVKTSYQQKDIPELSLSVPTRLLNRSNTDDYFLLDCALLDDGNPIFTGIVAQLPIKQVGQTTQFICDADLGRLAIEPTVEVHFQEVPVSTAIGLLLSNTMESTWAIDNTATLTDSEITLDVRDLSGMWAQIRGILDRCRYPTFLRYSHYDSGTHYVDLGSFGDQNFDVSINRDNITKTPKSRPTATIPIKSIQPITGTSGETFVPLSYALQADPSLADDASYPIIGDRVYNNTITRGIHIKKPMTAHKTSNLEIPNLSKKANAALSAYGQCVREIQKSNPRTVVDIEVALETPPLLNQLVYVDITVHEVVYNADTMQEETVNTFDMQQWIRVVAISQDFNAKLEVDTPATRIGTQVYKIKVSTADEIEDFDGDKYLIDILQDAGKKDKQIAIATKQRNEVTVMHSSAASDCTSGWGDGKTFTFALPSPPASATQVYTTVDVPNTRSYVITQPATLVDDLIICVSGENNTDWDTGDSLSVTAAFVFI